MFALGFKYHKTCRRRSPPVRHVDFWRPQKMPTFSRVLELSTWAIKPIRNIFLRLLAQSQVQEESKPFYQTAQEFYILQPICWQNSRAVAPNLFGYKQDHFPDLWTHTHKKKLEILLVLGDHLCEAWHWIFSFSAICFVVLSFFLKRFQKICFKKDKSCVEVFATGEASQYLFGVKIEINHR